jgi:hypothetical protein
VIPQVKNIVHAVQELIVGRMAQPEAA